MVLMLNIPDSLANNLGASPELVSQAVVEGFAVDAYRCGTLSSAEVGELLKHTSRWETEDFLAKHGAWPDTMEAEVLEDIHNLAQLHAA